MSHFSVSRDLQSVSEVKLNMSLNPEELGKIKVKKGQIIDITFENRDFQVIVIDPNGLGKGQPSVGFGYSMMSRHAGIPQQTLTFWGHRENGDLFLKLPSGNCFRVTEIIGQDNNTYTVVEASDWFDLVFDILEKPGKVSKSVKANLLSFIKWFAIKGFYASAYATLKGVYTAKDDRVLSSWLQTRISGIPIRNQYTDFLQSKGCSERGEYAYWTDYVYQGIFGRQAWEMKQFWKLIEGRRNIGRNYIREKGLEAVAHCERMVTQLYIHSLEQAHDEAVDHTKRKFFDGKQAPFEPGDLVD